MNHSFGTQLMAHGYCYLWSPKLLWLHAGSDALIALAYFIISIALIYLIRRRRQLPFYRMLQMFAAFIFACGVTHLFGIWTIWEPVYLIEGMLKLATAAISLATGLFLLPLLPHILALRSPAELEQANRELVLEIDRHKRTQQALHDAHAELEQRVIERTRELQQVNQRLQEQIDERQRAEQKLAETAAELKSFAYNIAHDLKAPLRAIRGFSQALSDDYKTDLNESGQLYISQIHAAAIRMGQLIDDLLFYSQLGRQNLIFLPVDLNQLIGQVQKNLNAFIETSEATIHIHGRLPTLRAHRATLEMAFQNLLSNALTFVTPGVKPEISFGTHEDKESCIVSITDNGVGIEAQFHRRIFGVFQRLHTREEYPGTGIGLAIVKKAVTLHDADITLTSVVGQGSTFEIRFAKQRLVR